MSGSVVYIVLEYASHEASIIASVTCSLVVAKRELARLREEVKNRDRTCSGPKRVDLKWEPIIQERFVNVCDIVTLERWGLRVDLWTSGENNFDHYVAIEEYPFIEEPEDASDQRSSSGESDLRTENQRLRKLVANLEIAFEALTATDEKKRRQLFDENQRLRELLQEARGCGAQGVRQHESIPECDHEHLHPDCIHCAREDARRCSYWESEAKRERNALREFMYSRGIVWDEFELAGKEKGDETVERSFLTVEDEDLGNLRTLTTLLIKKLDVSIPEINGFVALSTLRSGSEYHGPNFGNEMETIRKILKLDNPAAHPREFYPEGYCKPCDGSGEVPGGEGIASSVTRMNMNRYVVAVKDEERAKAWLLNIRAVTNATEAIELLSNLPLDIEYIGRRVAGVDDVTVSPKKDADLSMFEIEVRRPDWDRPLERKMKDVCRECRGTGGRGLPVPVVDRDERRQPIMATDVDE